MKLKLDPIAAPARLLLMLSSAFILAALLFPPAGAQQPSTKPQVQNSKGQEADEVINVETNLVNLNVRVIDHANRPVSDVRQNEFRIFEDGVPQTIVFFTREEVPIIYGLVIGNSSSLRLQIDKVIYAGKIIVSSNKPGDEAFLARLVRSKGTTIQWDFTSNKNELFSALDDLYHQGGATAIIDAVYLSAEQIAHYKKDLKDTRRRAMILVTDGEDHASYYKQEALFTRLREMDVQIYVIGFANGPDPKSGLKDHSKRQQAVSFLQRLAQETGGRAFFPNSVAELPHIANEITRDLRTQYVIGYTSTNKKRDGSFRTIRVTVADAPGRGQRIAITRSGYTAPRDSRLTTKSLGGSPPVRKL